MSPSSSTASTASETTDDPTTDAETSSSSSGSGSESTTGAPEQACGLEDLKPGAPDPIDAGTGPMQIPPDIAAIFLSSCGCHLADDLTVPDVPDYLSTGAFDMTTWAGFQAIPPSGSEPYHARALTYVQMEVMPLGSFCNVDGEAMDPADRETLVDWLSAGAPDGATWMP